MPDIKDEAAFFATAIQCAMEQFYDRHLSRSEANRAIRLMQDAVYTALHAVEHYETSGAAKAFVDRTLSEIASPEREPELLGDYRESLQKGTGGSGARPLGPGGAEAGTSGYRSGASIEDWWRAFPGGPGNREFLPFAATNREAGRRFEVPRIRHIRVSYKQWDGPVGPWAEHFGKGRQQVYPLDGGPPERSCNEVEVAKLLRKVRNEAYWISAYNPTRIPDLWRPWTIGPAQMPAWLRDLDRRIRLRTRNMTGGIPDVVAWDDGNRALQSAIFVECKAPKEKIKDTQEDWMAAAIQEGVSSSQLAVALRVF